MKRIHIPNEGPDPETVPKALAIGLRECKQIGSSELALITSVKDGLDSDVVGKFLGPDVAKRLMQGKKVAVGDHGVSLTHHSVATVQKATVPAVGLAFYVVKDAIKKLDDLSFDCLILVPWIAAEGEQWAQKWGAETHGGSTADSSVILPDEVEDSLRSLSICVNLSTGLGHPSDKEHAKRKFSELREQGLTWDADEIEKWAVRNGWKAADAEELSTLSASYL